MQLDCPFVLARELGCAAPAPLRGTFVVNIGRWFGGSSHSQDCQKLCHFISFLNTDAETTWPFVPIMIHGDFLSWSFHVDTVYRSLVLHHFCGRIGGDLKTVHCHSLSFFK